MLGARTLRMNDRVAAVPLLETLQHFLREDVLEERLAVQHLLQVEQLPIAGPAWTALSVASARPLSNQKRVMKNVST